MVLLVRCRDNTCSVALKSRLNDLMNDGLITAYLRNGEWVAVHKRETRRTCTLTLQTQAIGPPVAATI
jgi:hypothetical protein